MIRLLGLADEERLHAFCQRAPEQNIVMLANLAQLGGDGGLVQFWGDGGEEPQAVLMRYGNLWYVDATLQADLAGLAGVISRTGQAQIVLNGVPETVAALAPLIAEYQVDLRLPARIRMLSRSPASAQGPGVRRATLADVEALAAFYASAPQDLRRGPESLRRSLVGGRRAFVAVRGRAITACALTTAELPSLALAGGLHGEGRMWDADLEAALGALCASLQSEGKRVCVVTRDLWIDRICIALGFADLAPWTIIHLKR